MSKKTARKISVEKKGPTLIYLNEQDTELPKAGQNLVAVLNSPHGAAIDFFTGADIYNNIEAYWAEGNETEIIPPEYHEGYAPEDIDLEILTKYANKIHRGFRIWQGHRLLKLGSEEQKKAEAADVASDLQHCLNEVPKEYFDENFDISQSSVLLNTDKKSSHSAMITQEKLSNYLDLVELNLIRHIYSQSDAFFGALKNIQKINEEVTDTINSIEEIRKKIKLMHKYSISKAYKVVRGRVQKKNIMKLTTLTERIKDVVACRQRVDELMAQNDYGSAIQLIQEGQKILKNELSEIKCLDKTRKYFNEITLNAKGTLVSQFLELTCYKERRSLAKRSSLKNVACPEWWIEAEESVQEHIKSLLVDFNFCNHHSIQKLVQEAGLEEQDAQSFLFWWFRDSPKHGHHTEKSQRLEILLRAIMEIGDLHTIIPPYLQQVKDNIIKTVKLIFLEQMNDISMEKIISHESNTQLNSQLTFFIQNLEHDKFLEIWLDLVDRLYQDLCQVEVTEKLVLKILHSSLVEAREAEKFSKSISTLVSSMCEYALTRCSKILVLREEKHTNLTLQQLKDLVGKSMSVIKKIEKLAGENNYEIRGNLMTQAKNFLECFHQQHLDRLKEMLEQEEWKAEDIPSQFQLLLKYNFQEPQRDESSGTHGLYQKYNWDDDIEGDEDEENEEEDAAKNLLEVLILEVEGEDMRFRLVKSCIGVLSMIREYVEVANALPAIAADVFGRLVKLIHVFNNRTYQLVLCAGAMTQVGLKSISSKHLSVSFSCISLLSCVLPRLIGPFIQTLDKSRGKILRSSLDRTKKDLDDHQREIHKKLVDVMKDLINDKCDAFLQLDWALNNKGKEGTLEFKPDEPISILMKRTKYVHKILTAYLGKQKRDAIFKEVTRYFATKLYGTLECLETKDNEFISNRLHWNAKFVIDRLNKIGCCSEDVRNKLSRFLMKN